MVKFIINIGIFLFIFNFFFKPYDKIDKINKLNYNKILFNTTLITKKDCIINLNESCNNHIITNYYYNNKNIGIISYYLYNGQISLFHINKKYKNIGLEEYMYNNSLNHINHIKQNNINKVWLLLLYNKKYLYNNIIKLFNNNITIKLNSFNLIKYFNYI